MADNFVVAPTPMIAPVMVWVIETGIPPRVESRIEAAAAASAPLHLGLIRNDEIRVPFSRTIAKGCFLRQESLRQPASG
jgi:hypothetical protein